MLRSRRSVAFVLALVAALAAALFAPLLTYRRVQSPDGEFTAVAKGSLFWSLVPMMPGQAGDKPGRVTIVRRDGASCGSAAVEMLNSIGELRWHLDGKPREASIVAAARWDLDACRVELFKR